MVNAYARLQLGYKFGERLLYLGSPCSREHIQNIDNSISMYKYFCRSIQRKTNNNDNSSREILSKQWPFYQRFSELAHF